MEFSNILEKIETVFNLIVDSNALTILTLIIIMMLLLKLVNKISNKKMAIFTFFVELAVLGFTFYEGKEFLVKISTELIDSIFLNFYFPSIYIYSFIFVVSFAIFIYTLLNRFISKIYRIITNTYFLTFNFIFILLLDIISKNNIDIFAKESLFTNNNSLILLELSTLLFFLYIVIMSLVYFTNSIILLVGDKKVSTETIETVEKYNNELEIINPNVIPREEAKKDYIPNPTLSFQELVKNIQNVQEPVVKIDLVPEVDLTKNIKLNNEDYKFINPVLITEPFSNNVVKTKEVESFEGKLNFIDFNILENKKEDKLTLNDYKQFSDMLKTVIQNNNDSNMSIKEILDRGLLNKYSFEEYTKFEKILNSYTN